MPGTEAYSLDPFIYFDGECREALEFYAAVFEVDIPERIMTYDVMPDAEEKDVNRVLYSSLPIFKHNIMLADQPAGTPYQRGGAVALTLGTPDKALVERVFSALSDGGDVLMPLCQTFFSDYYGMVRDRFGITWQLSVTSFS